MDLLQAATRGDTLSLEGIFSYFEDTYDPETVIEFIKDINSPLGALGPDFLEHQIFRIQLERFIYSTIFSWVAKEEGYDLSSLRDLYAPDRCGARAIGNAVRR